MIFFHSMFVIDGCCGLSLRTGALIIGVLDMVFDSLHLLGGVANLVGTSGVYIKEGDSKDPWIVAFLVMEMLVGIVDFIFSAVLLNGVHKESVKKVMAWWWWTSLQLLMQVIFFIAYAIFKEVITGLLIVVAALILALSVFSLVVVRSYAFSLKKKLTSEILIQEREEMIDL